MSLKSIFYTLLAGSTLWAGHALAETIEKVETYAISGTTGPALYAAIGEKGPLIGKNIRTIAHTNFTLL